MKNLLLATVVILSSIAANARDLTGNELDQTKRAVTEALNNSNSSVECALLDLTNVSRNADKGSVSEGTQPLITLEVDGYARILVTTSSDYRKIASVTYQRLGYQDVNSGDLRNPQVSRQVVVIRSVDCPIESK